MDRPTTSHHLTRRRAGPGWSRRTVLKAAGVGMTTPLIGGVAAAQRVQRVVEFEGVGPENLAIDPEGNVYMTMNFSGEVRRLDADDASATGLGIDDTTLVTTLDPGPDGFITGVVETDGTLYVALASFGGGDDHGVWEVMAEAGGDVSPLADLPPDRLPNGVLLDAEAARLLVTDSARGEVVSVGLPDGDVETWLDDDRLDPATFIGANGIAFGPDGDVYVANLDAGRIVRVPVEAGGSAGDPKVYAEDPALVGADGIAFHEGRTLYVAVNGQDAVARVTPAGAVQTVADGADGLDFPADVAFGPPGGPDGPLFVANFALNPETGTIEGEPSLARTAP